MKLILNVNEDVKFANEMQQIKKIANETKRTEGFLWTMAHEIRTPLNSIVGFCDVMKMMDNQMSEQEREQMVQGIQDNNLLLGTLPIAEGGLFCSLLRFSAPLGYDILTPREVRLDAFLFGEEVGRYLVALPEEQDDAFLLKMDEARLNCCFLGRTTKNRLLVDGFDFGPVSDYIAQ